MAGMNTGCEGIRRKEDAAHFEPHLLPNGIKLWLQNTQLLKKEEEGVVVAFLPKVGSRCDPPNALGTAHFFEHLPFLNGTLGKPSVQQLATPIEKLGGHYYAHTKMELSRYFVRTPSDGSGTAFETLYEMIAKPRVTEDFVRRERGAIAQEARKMIAGEDTGSVPYYVFHHLYQNLFRDHALGHIPRGNPEHVEAMTPEILTDFWKMYYHAGNIQLVCGGSFAQQKDVLERIANVFGAIRKDKPVDLGPDPLLNSLANDRTVVSVPKAATDSLTIVYPIPASGSYGSRESALEFLANVIGGWGYTSPLFVELRQKQERAKIYSLNCFAENFTGVWLLWFHVGIDSADFGLAQDTFIRVLKELKSDLVVTRQKERQLKRKVISSSPIDDCIFRATDDITDFGRCISWHKREAIEDDITDQVLDWRDLLIDSEPFVLEIKSGS